MLDILSPDSLREFFQIEDDILKRRESAQVEFKEMFDWSNKSSRIKYLKTIIGFANNKGGRLIFGIKKSPHKVIGCTGFNSVDISEITNEMKNYFHCHCFVQKETYIYKDMTIGIIHVPQSDDAPIICIKKAFNEKGEPLIGEGDIYFRYSGQTEKIRAGDLVNLINGIKERVNLRWMNSMKTIGNEGIYNLGILNTKSGGLSVGNTSFLLDESLLKELRFVDQFSEKEDGAPAIKIIGSIEGAAHVVARHKHIQEFEIVEEFLLRNNQFDVSSISYLIPNLQALTYPILYFLDVLGMSEDEYKIKILGKAKFSSENKFIKNRLGHHAEWIRKKQQLFPVGKKGYKSLIRAPFVDSLRDKKEPKAGTTAEVESLLECYFHLDNIKFDLFFCRKMLHKMYLDYYSDSKLASKIREACCALDIIEFADR